MKGTKIGVIVAGFWHWLIVSQISSIAKPKTGGSGLVKVGLDFIKRASASEGKGRSTLSVWFFRSVRFWGLRRDFWKWRC